MESLTINGKTINSELISFRELGSGLDSLEKKTIQIIRSWQIGQEVFTFQTSGSTGTPGELNFTREKIALSAQRTLDFFNVRPGDVAVCCLNTDFVAGFMMVIRALIGGLKLIVIEPTSDPWPVISNEKRVNFIAVTPQQMESGLHYPKEYFNNISTILIGGAALHPSLDKQLQQFSSSIYQSYAMTETLTHVAVREVNGSRKSENYVALQGVSFKIDKGNCLIIHDEILGIKQLNTNDVVELVDDKSFRWIGRKDNIINSGGIKIQLEQLEERIAEIFSTNDVSLNFCIVAIPDVKFTNKVVLLIHSPENTVEVSLIKNMLKTALPPYHCPAGIKLVSELFMTKSGKLDRIKMSRHYLHY